MGNFDKAFVYKETVEELECEESDYRNILDDLKAIGVLVIALIITCWIFLVMNLIGFIISCVIMK